jgi:hypothetical protein
MYRNYRASLLVLATIIAACDPATPPPQGAAAIAWSIAGSGGRHQACSAVGAASVSLLLHPHRGGDAIASFPCADGQGITHAVAAGAYDATLTLRSETGAVIATGPTQLGVAIEGTAPVTLAPVVFTVSPTGRLSLAMTTLGTDSNCGALATRGAGITATTIAIERIDSHSCTPALLLRTRGDGTSNGAYLVNCFRPTPTTCIERDESLTTGTLAAGDYTVRANGLRDNAVCWSAARTFTIPGGGAQADVALQLTAATGPGC